MQKGNVILMMILVLAFGLASCTGKNNEDKLRKGWTLVWEDDFESETGLAAWSKIPRGKQFMDRYMSDNDALYVLEDGYLVLRAVKNAADSTELPFLTGGISRQGMKRDDIGRIEMKVCMKPAAKAVPFITLLPTDGTENISVNIMERYGYDKFIYQSVSSEYTAIKGGADNPISNVLVGVDPNQFHIYGVEKYPDSLVFLVDNTRTKIYPRVLTGIPGQFPYNDMDFDLFIGIKLYSDADPEDLPADMFIDWIRYYEPEEGILQE